MAIQRRPAPLLMLQLRFGLKPPRRTVNNVSVGRYVTNLPAHPTGHLVGSSSTKDAVESSWRASALINCQAADKVVTEWQGDRSAVAWAPTKAAQAHHANPQLFCVYMLWGMIPRSGDQEAPSVSRVPCGRDRRNPRTMYQGNAWSMSCFKTGMPFSQPLFPLRILNLLTQPPAKLSASAKSCIAAGSHVVELLRGLSDEGRTLTFTLGWRKRAATHRFRTGDKTPSFFEAEFRPDLFMAGSSGHQRVSQVSWVTDMHLRWCGCAEVHFDQKEKAQAMPQLLLDRRTAKQQLCDLCAPPQTCNMPTS